MATKLEKSITIKLIKSLISCKEDQIATANSLGLRKIDDEVTQPNNPQTLGKINRIRHLVKVK